MSRAGKGVVEAGRGGGAGAPEAGEVVEVLMRLLHTGRRLHYGRFSDRELSGPRMRLLGALSDRQPLRMGDLAARLGLTARTITTLVDALEREGLLARRPDATDRRATLIELTDTGCEYLDRVGTTLGELAEQVLAPLDADERRQLLGLLSRLEVSCGAAESGHDRVEPGEQSERRSP